MKIPSCYFVVRESRPHTDAPHINNVRYIANGGGMEHNFVCAQRFENAYAAINAVYAHARIISNEKEYVAPPETKLEVIKCDFSETLTLSLADFIEEDVALQHMPKE